MIAAAACGHYDPNDLQWLSAIFAYNEQIHTVSGTDTMWRAWLLFVVTLTVALAALPARAAALAPADGPVLLTVEGSITETNAGDRAELDRATLTALGLHKVRTSTPWTNGVVEFEGPLLCDLLDFLGARGTKLFASALNDYTAEIPIEDCRRYPVILALRQDGRNLRVRDKGPIWIVYPRDDHPELYREIVNSRWVWQLARLDVR